MADLIMEKMANLPKDEPLVSSALLFLEGMLSHGLF